MNTLRNNFRNAGYTRPAQGRIIGGVCAGVARQLGVTPNIARVITLLLALLPGPMWVAYLAAWIVMPEDAKPSPDQPG